MVLVVRLSFEAFLLVIDVVVALGIVICRDGFLGVVIVLALARLIAVALGVIVVLGNVVVVADVVAFVVVVVVACVVV